MFKGVDHVQSTRNKLIELLYAHPKKFISGQILAEKLGLSRNAIWKHIKELEKDGYKIEAQPSKGYRIIQVPHDINANTLKWGLETDWLGKKIIHKASVSSTQSIAHNLAREGAPHGTVVIADEQTDGKGRMDRSFHSSAGKGIWMSILIRPQILPYLAPQITLLTATVLAETIENMVDVQTQIKWPNDVLIEEKKVSGILTEMQAEQDQIQYVIIGIGLNVFHQEKDFHKDIREKSTSIRLHTDHSIHMQSFIQTLLHTFEAEYESFIAKGFPPVKEKWEKYGFKIGQMISIQTMRRKWHALFLGIAADGALITQIPGEDPERIYSAEIEWFKT